MVDARTRVLSSGVVARPMNVDKRVASIARLAARARINATNSRRWADELTRVYRGSKASKAAERAYEMADCFDMVARAFKKPR